MEINPFHTERFGWIDCLVGNNFESICENYSPNMLPKILNEKINDFLWVYISDVQNIIFYSKEENKKEYYKESRPVICSSLFICNKNVGSKIMERFKQLFIDSIKFGYCYGDETIYLKILNEYDNQIRKSYGPRNCLLNNFISITTGLQYIRFNIMKRSLDYLSHKECIHCGKKILQEYKKGNIETTYLIDFFSIMDMYYVACYYTDKPRAQLIIDYLFTLCQFNPVVRQIFETRKDYYFGQFIYMYY